MPSRSDNRVSTRGHYNSQQAEDVTKVGSYQPNNGQGSVTVAHSLYALVILRREPTRKELFRACFSKDGITQNVEAANTVEQIDELTSQHSKHELDEPGPQDIYSKVMGNDKNGTVEMYGPGV
ncbi:hypothetical protein Tco_1057096 [Tanacetum coccineum]|uniref:Uncharacterized protein n=1 Tax=Tanacetum coccineum TaxID=301880 RepID=A0ABQ5H5T2_9ASTR